MALLLFASMLPLRMLPSSRFEYPQLHTLTPIAVTLTSSRKNDWRRSGLNGDAYSLDRQSDTVGTQPIGACRRVTTRIGSASHDKRFTNASALL